MGHPTLEGARMRRNHPWRFSLAVFARAGIASIFTIGAFSLTAWGLEASAEKSTAHSSSRGDLLVIVGSPGTDEYAGLFRSWAQRWSDAGTAGHLSVTSLGTKTDDGTLPILADNLSRLGQESSLPLWIVLIGHGTFDGKTAKFNLPGIDLDPVAFAQLLDKLKRPVAVINCTSCSGPFLSKLAKPDRIVMTATNTGNEVNFARFGGFLAESISDPAADLDKDEQVSLLEAFLRASKRTEQFYSADGRLPTEHAVLDDNGDGRAVPGDGFEGIRPVNRQDSGSLLPDGFLTHQWILVPSPAQAARSPEIVIQQNQIERKIAELRSRKHTMPPDEYYAALEPLFVEMAKLLVPVQEPITPPKGLPPASSD
jgi:hypothetical protein